MDETERLREAEILIQALLEAGTFFISTIELDPFDHDIDGEEWEKAARMWLEANRES